MIKKVKSFYPYVKLPNSLILTNNNIKKSSCKEFQYFKYLNISQNGQQPKQQITMKLANYQTNKQTKNAKFFIQK